MTESSFLKGWHSVMSVGVIIIIVLSIVVYLVYKIRVSAFSDNKKKHDFINLNEVKWYKWAYFLLGVAVVFAINLYGEEKYKGIGLWFFVRLFVSLCAGTLVGYVSSLVLDYYYPSVLNAKLRKLRYSPRVNPKTGNKMKLLSESEEDVHLDEGMLAEESLFSVDYDVWIDEKTSDVKIEKYDGHMIALQCNNCGFYTMKVKREEITEMHEDGSPKELLKHYQCTYCENVRSTVFNVSKKEADDYKALGLHVKSGTKNVATVKIDLHSNFGKKKSFEF
ncbi:MAG: hypothetical protein ORN54_15165, partial [Cyclobacteriaceae bacterium]|nr:hypothetical protein [Cyclobacteriaceae bacterium]